MTSNMKKQIERTVRLMLLTCLGSDTSYDKNGLNGGRKEQTQH